MLMVLESLEDFTQEILATIPFEKQFFYKPLHDLQAVDLLEGIINKYVYLEEDLIDTDSSVSHNQFNLLYFITDVFILLLKKHLFLEGNKRFALLYLKAFLYQFGWHLEWTTTNLLKTDSNSVKPFDSLSPSPIENTLVHFIKELQGQKDYSIIRQEIYDWIKARIVLIK
ncbi:hypothetical protein J2Z62_000222 [Mycoplasmoides fastidiosum]|uniref:Fido domain-containing protein n=1 Tax=Mycoplasmoides fastidiosum TaxID=92758 RepID=A0ABU0LYJ2_9BACT|nr:hypothetical protein [Mycoplasmoides fastidiosum]MDQ0513784.1 hypothetical protein [Mycoplasmoides fastidiosum]UUD37798.1 hypothetical protein NPA10_00145 [Mycoplasmoides fastidiosum]